MHNCAEAEHSNCIILTFKLIDSRHLRKDTTITIFLDSWHTLDELADDFEHLKAHLDQGYIVSEMHVKREPKTEPEP